ncbi:MAG: chemotaxis protein CheD [Spirochaetota bacterium]|nr:chemotaxis protein CheD [Spirochaetota bacterium]
MEFKLITVPIADYKISQSPDILRTILGSCVGICLYDPESRIGGLAHIMLPENNDKSTNPKKYADSAIALMIDELRKKGAHIEHLVAKIAGGASMFKMPENSFIGSIGINNIQKVREILDNYRITIISQDVFGDYGRTVDFFLETGKLKIKSLGREDKEI